MDSIINSTFFIIPEPSYTQVKYGYLYNWFAVNDSRNICADGWHIPTKTEIETLTTYLGGALIAGGKLKETGTMYWESPNIGATNEVGFNARGGSSRYLGAFETLKWTNYIWTSTISGSNACYLLLTYTGQEANVYDDPHISGYSIRPIKNSTTLTHGQTGTYIGNDGKIYRTICIGTQEWLADNLAETKYRNGDNIPTITDNSEWAALITGAKCAFNNDESNVLIS